MTIAHKPLTNHTRTNLFVQFIAFLIWTTQALPKPVFDWVFKMGVALFPLDEKFVQQNLAFREDKYGWLDILPNPWIEFKMCFWLQGQTSLSHDHADSRNFTKVIRGQVTARLYQVKKSELILTSEEVVGANQMIGVQRYQIHELINLSPEPCITFHCYCPKRPD